ncbi:MAG: hypothetical protein JWN87_668 [Frankiales bacterium]|nr:hypothetical protein [Frankiales bacterium]
MSSRRKNAKADATQKKAATPFVSRPFAGRPDETEWVALREIVPAATAPLALKGSDVPVTLSTVLPLAWPGMVTLEGRRLLGVQVATRSGDASRDLAFVLEQVLTAEPGTSISPTELPGPGPRLQDLLDDAPLTVTVHAGFDYWLEGAEDADGEIHASMERANTSVVPTAKLESVQSAYWCRMRERAHLRWVLPEDEEPLLDALARLAVDGGLGLGEGTRYVGSFRAHGLLVPVWDLPVDTEADAVEAPAAAFRERLSAALTQTAPLPADARRARAGLLSRQLTLR